MCVARIVLGWPRMSFYVTGTRRAFRRGMDGSSGWCHGNGLPLWGGAQLGKSEAVKRLAWLAENAEARFQALGECRSYRLHFYENT